MQKITSKYKNAWLLGSSGGIGNSIFSILSEYSENIYTCDNKNDNAPPELNFMHIDCSKESELRKFAEQATKEHGAPDVMIIAAGYVSNIDLDVTSEEEMEKIFKMNFKLVALAMKVFFEFCDKSKEIRKTIIIISSNAGLEARPNQPIYAAMKSAVNSLVKSQAVAWGKYNLRVNAIAPGTVAVPRNIEALKNKLPKFPYDDTRPLGKIANPEDLHNICRLLLEPELLLTGQILVVDGGSSLV